MLTATAFAVLLVAGTVVSTWQALVATSAVREANIQRASEKRERELRNEAQNEKARAVEASALAEGNEAIASEQAKLALESLGLFIDKMQRQLGNTPGVQDLRKDLLETALDGLDRVTKESGTESKMQAMMANAYLKMGIILTEFNRSKEAATYFERCYAITKNELGKQPDNDFLKERLALASIYLGELKQRAPRDMQKTVEYYEEAFRLREEIARRPDAERRELNKKLRPEERLRTSAIKVNLSDGYTRVGLLHYFQQDSHRAEPYILRSLALREQLSYELAVRYAAFSLCAPSFGCTDPIGQLVSLSATLEMPGQYTGRLGHVFQSTTRNYFT